MDPTAIWRDDWARARAASLRIGQDWGLSPVLARLADTFDQVAATDVDIARQRAVTLLTDTCWVAELLAPLVQALADDPLFDPPLKVHRERGRIGAVFFDCAAARISASVVDPRAWASASSSVVMPGHVAVSRYVRAGGVRLRRWRVAVPAETAGRSAIEIDGLSPRDGDVVVLDGRSDGQVATGASGAIVTVTAILRAGAAATVREYATADGRLLRTATTDDGASRGAMLRTFLRVSGRADAGEVFAAATRDDAAHVRWQAMREWLALDAGSALPRLSAMAAEDGSDEIRSVAAATLGLARSKMAQCPA